ncbi:MAG TPA: hypothetical protein VMU06_13785 [Stellaceae bacterium]|nr:hypothetical protein [Stellaceae bacterium]
MFTEAQRKDLKATFTREASRLGTLLGLVGGFMLGRALDAGWLAIIVATIVGMGMGGVLGLFVGGWGSERPLDSFLNWMERRERLKRRD